MTGSVTELLIGLGLAIVGYLLRHYGVKVPGLPKSTPTVPTGPAVSGRGPVLTAVLAFLSQRMGVPLPLLLDAVPTKPPEPVPTGPVQATGPTDSDADIRLALDLLKRHLPDSGKGS